MATELRYDEKAFGVAAHPTDSKNGYDPSRRKSSIVDAEVLTGEIYDERYEGTKRGLKSRHAQMIALGGTIGTGLFVGSGQTLATGGPAFILGCYIFMAFLVWCIVSAITEVAAWLPTKGCSMNMFGYRYVSRSLGFAMGWLYWYSLGILVPYEVRLHMDKTLSVYQRHVLILLPLHFRSPPLVSLSNTGTRRSTSLFGESYQGLWTRTSADVCFPCF